MKIIMDKRNSEILSWLRNHLYKKYKIPKRQTQAVLDAISDLRWDWKHSKYDLYGLCIEEVLADLGAARAPYDKKEDVC
jgi:hypothetical protein